MKKFLTFLLCMVCLLSACGTSQPKIEDPVTFYYPRTEYVFGQTDSIIASETRKAPQIKTNLSTQLSEYLQGPASADLRNPFPADTEILGIRLDSGILQLTMNDKFSQLSGMELTIACACLTKTGIELTGCKTVQIVIDGTLPDTQRIIIMNDLTLLLMDDIITTHPQKLRRDYETHLVEC